MNKFLAALAAITVLSTPALAQSTGPKAGTKATTGMASKTADFVNKVAISDMFEIESSKLAATSGGTATQAFANQMIADHTKTSSELKSNVSDNAMQMPTALDRAHQTKLDKLKNLTGAKFDAEYRTQQIAAHKDAVTLFKRYSTSGDDQKLKAWAAQTLPALQHHLEMAQALNARNSGSRALSPGQKPATGDGNAKTGTGNR